MVQIGQPEAARRVLKGKEPHEFLDARKKGPMQAIHDTLVTMHNKGQGLIDDWSTRHDAVSGSYIVWAEGVGKAQKNAGYVEIKKSDIESLASYQELKTFLNRRGYTLSAQTFGYDRPHKHQTVAIYVYKKGYKYERQAP